MLCTSIAVPSRSAAQAELQNDVCQARSRTVSSGSVACRAVSWRRALAYTQPRSPITAVAISFQPDARRVATGTPSRRTGIHPLPTPAEPALPTSSTCPPSADPGSTGDALAGHAVQQVAGGLAQDVAELGGAGLHGRTLPGRRALRLQPGVLGHPLRPHGVPGVGDQDGAAPAPLAEGGRDRAHALQGVHTLRDGEECVA